MVPKIATALLQAVLWVWFLGCTISYRAKGYVLVDGMGLKSPEFAMLCLYSAALLCFYLLPFGRWILLSLLLLWLVVQFFCHWYYTIFGASAKKLKGYNDCFKDTVLLFPARDTRLIPDLYHIVLHALLLINLFLCLAAA